MLCPKCKFDGFRVTDSTQYYDTDGAHCLVIRARECLDCKYKQKTIERVEFDKPKIRISWRK